MPYCLKCGVKVEEAMTFCPNCGTQLKTVSQLASDPVASPNAAPVPNPTPQPKAETNVPSKKPELPPYLKPQGRADRGFIKYLAAGLILVTVGASMILELTNPQLASGEYLALTLFIIGLIVILSAVYAAFSGRHHARHVKPQKPADKPPAQPTA